MEKRDLIIIIAALVAAIALAAAIFSGNTLQAGAWGLSLDRKSVV